jgi:hypothetical protein
MQKEGIALRQLIGVDKEFALSQSIFKDNTQ